MPISQSSTSNVLSTLNGSGAKKKTVRKTATPAAKAPAKRTVLGEEILFKDAPNPAKTPIPPYLWIDYPTENEVLTGPVYVLRFGVGGATTVELSIDKGAWLPCRHAAGYWWYDWNHVSAGKHTLVARMRTTDGTWYRTPPRTCVKK